MLMLVWPRLIVNLRILGLIWWGTTYFVQNNNYYYTPDSLWKVWLVESIQSIHNSLWTWHDKCNICSRYCIYYVKFTSFYELIECYLPIRFFIVSLMYNNGNKHNSLHLAQNKLGYLSLDIICSSKITVFLELRLSENCSLLGTDDIRGEIS